MYLNYALHRADYWLLVSNSKILNVLILLHQRVCMTQRHKHHLIICNSEKS